MVKRGMNKQMRSIFTPAGKNEVGPLKANTFYTANSSGSGIAFTINRFRAKGAWSWKAVGADGTEVVAVDLPAVAVALGYTLVETEKPIRAAPKRSNTKKREVVFVRPATPPV